MREGDFTSAHFLGLRPSGSSAALTTGRPAAVEDRETGRVVARDVARATGAADGIIARTSLHGLIDVLATRSPRATLLLDEAIYPIGSWAAGAVTMAEPGAEVLWFRHHDARDAARKAARKRRVVVVTDGLCGSCLRPAPLGDLQEVARRYDGELVVDDTLAAGVLGSRDKHDQVLGNGGSGTAAWMGANAGHVTVASLAKGLSAPLAVVTGPSSRIDQVRRDGPSRIHAGPPTSADVGALRSALADDSLEARRIRLGRLVQRTRRIFEELDLRPLGVPFPVLATEGGRSDPLDIHRALASFGIRSLATTGRCTGRPALTLCVRADHSNAELERLERALCAAISERSMA